MMRLPVRPGCQPVERGQGCCAAHQHLSREDVGALIKQHLAQDAFGRLLYSTLPTAAAGDGTMRVADKQPGWQQAEVRLLLG